jgi:hypothetical protein
VALQGFENLRKHLFFFVRKSYDPWNYSLGRIYSNDAWWLTLACGSSLSYSMRYKRRAVKRKILGIVESPTVEVPAEHLALSVKGLLDNLTAP